MEPYFTDGQVTLYVGDCREILPVLGLEANCVIADPPYGETPLPWDRWPDGWLDIAAKVSRSLWCFGSMRMFAEHWQEFRTARWKFSQDVVWEKHNGSGIAADRFRRVHEQATHWYRGPWSGIHHDAPRVQAEIDPRSRHHIRPAAGPRAEHLGAVKALTWEDDGTRIVRSVMKVRSTHHAAIHPTEKPLALLTSLITYASPRGGLVVDPFAGSASTLDAARQSGRRAVGIEANEEYAEKAARRLSQATLFSGETA